MRESIEWNRQPRKRCYAPVVFGFLMGVGFCSAAVLAIESLGPEPTTYIGQEVSNKEFCTYIMPTCREHTF